MSADCELYIFVEESLQIRLVCTNFAADSLAHPVSGWVKTFWKGRLRTLSSTIESRKFEHQEDTATEAFTSGVLYPAGNIWLRRLFVYTHGVG